MIKTVWNSLRKNGYQDQLYLWEGFTSKVQEALQAKLSKTQTDDDSLYENAPQDFIDPFTYMFMEDPVKLPTSGITMDWSSIKRMLLNDEWDPINWKPLKMSDL